MNTLEEVKKNIETTDINKLIKRNEELDKELAIMRRKLSEELGLYRN